MKMAHESGRMMGLEGLNPVAVNITGCSGFGFFNSVSQTRSLAQCLQTLEIRAAPCLSPNPYPKNLGMPVSPKHSSFDTSSFSGSGS